MQLTILNVFHVLLAIAMIGIILVQRGPGATAGAAFGGGASGTMFGSRGASSFLTRTTAILATAFFGLSMVMGIIASRSALPEAQEDLGVMGRIEQPAPATDVPPTDLPVAAPTAGDAPAATDVPAITIDAAPAEPAVDDAATESEDDT